MKTILDQTVRQELITRIDKLSSDLSPQWGKMAIYQMIDHMNIWNDWVFGKNNLPHQQGLFGKVLGKWMLKKDTKDDTPMAKGMPSGKGFVNKEMKKDIDELKNKWIDSVREYESFSEPFFYHDFYGKMTREQLGIFAYKHMDHHLRQFGV